MSAGAIVAIIVAVVVVILVIALMTTMRRRQLRQRFGPEYDRVAGEMRSQRKADAELAERERRVRSLDVHPLDETTRVKYAAEWTAIQERFVDQPEQAVTQAGLLVTSVMKDRGYPTEEHNQIVADLSVEHAGTLEHFRAAHQISVQAEAGTVTTENLRLAMLHYRALFSDLLGQPPDAPQSEAPQSGPPPAATEPPPEAAPAAAPGAGAATDTRSPVTEPRSRPSG
jgi:Tfp pilus assembly protein PilX